MTIKRYKITKILDIIEKIKNQQFNINTQYKLLLLKKYIKEDLEVIDEQYQLLLEQYGERTDSGVFVKTDDGGIKIKDNCLEDCKRKIQEFNTIDATLPEIYFTIEELEELQLTFNELEAFMPFIKI